MYRPADLREHLPLLLIIILGIALRFYNLGAESIWLDEALSWQQASLPLGEMFRSISADVHPPLFALILHATISLFGDSEFAMRMPSAVFGSISIWLTFAVCRQLMHRQVALLGAFLAAVSVFAVRYSQEIRMYSLSSCLTLLSMLFLLRMLDKDSHVKQNFYSAAYCISTVLLIYSHIYGLFIVLVQNIYVFGLIIARPPATLALRRWVVLQLALGIAFLPWASVLLEQISRAQSDFWLQKPDSGNLKETFRLYMGSMSGLLLAVTAALCGYIALLLQRCFGDRFNTSLPSDNPGHAWLLLSLWLLLPVFLPFILSQFMQPFYNGRYTIVSTYAWYMLVAAGGMSIGRRSVRYLLLTALIAMVCAALPFYYQNGVKTDWRAITAFVDEQAVSGDLVLFNKADIYFPYRYYSQRDDLRLMPATSTPDWDHGVINQQSGPDPATEVLQHERVWLVSGYDRDAMLSEAELLRQLTRSHLTLEGREFRAIRVFSLRQKKPE